MIQEINPNVRKKGSGFTSRAEVGYLQRLFGSETSRDGQFEARHGCLSGRNGDAATLGFGQGNRFGLFEPLANRSLKLFYIFDGDLGITVKGLEFEGIRDGKGKGKGKIGINQ